MTFQLNNKIMKIYRYYSKSHLKIKHIFGDSLPSGSINYFKK